MFNVKTWYGSYLEYIIVYEDLVEDKLQTWSRSYIESAQEYIVCKELEVYGMCRRNRGRIGNVRVYMVEVILRVSDSIYGRGHIGTV